MQRGIGSEIDDCGFTRLQRFPQVKTEAALPEALKTWQKLFDDYGKRVSAHDKRTMFMNILPEHMKK